jgi:chitinase
VTPRRLLPATVCILALAGGCSLTLGGTVSAYTASVTAASSSFAAAADFVAPGAATAPIGRSTAYDTGYIDQGAAYYVYANVTDTGNPASGIASVTTNVSSITSGDTAVTLTAGTYSAGGTAYNYRSAVLTAAATLAAGSHTYTITSTDKAANVATQSFTTTVDNTPPAASDVQSTNVSGGTVGRLDKGDSFTLTYTSTMDPYSILSGWTGATTDVAVGLVDGGGTTSDYLQVYTAASTPTSLTQIAVGTVYLNSPNYIDAGTYMTFGISGSAVPSTMTRNGASITIVLGTPSTTPDTNTTPAAMTWTPSTTATDIAGNANTATTVTQSGTIRVNF